MFKILLGIAAAGLLGLAFAPSTAHAWGGCRSFSGGGAAGGSWSHTGASVGGGGYGGAHYGSTSYTGPNGNTWSNSHAGWGGDGTGWHNANNYHDNYYYGGACAPGWGATYVAPTVGVYDTSDSYDSSNSYMSSDTPNGMQYGAIVAALPAGYTTRVVGGVTYYISPPNWFTVQTTGNGPSFVCVPPP